MVIVLSALVMIFVMCALAGHYVTPDYVSPLATRIIARMLVVDPIQRATVKEVR